MKKILFLILTALFLFTLFSYKLTEIPSGVTIDESAFGYNGILLSKTFRDENHRFLPVFVLSIQGKDWRQPVTQYLIALSFRLFGPSLYNLRVVSVVTVVISVILIYFLGKKLLGNSGGIAAGIFLATTPIIMIQSHLGLDNIAPVPFVILWLLTLFLFEKDKKYFWLVISAISLGIGYYSYKGMRVFVPIWVILTALYLGREFLSKMTKKVFPKAVKPVLFFCISIFPFFAVIPVLEYFYSGAVLDHTHFVFEGFYKVFYPYLSSFDPSFLFIKGDDILIHSTGWHGMYLLFSLPFFLAGLSFWKKGSFWKLIILSFFLGPLLFGVANSVHRASRMLAEVPLYSLISAAGFLYIWQMRKKIILLILTVALAANYYDFLHYYWTKYAADTSNLFYCFTCAQKPYNKLKELSTGKNLVPYVDEVVAKREDTTFDFARTIYFLNRPASWDAKQGDLPKNAVLMTDNDNINYLQIVGKQGNLFYYVQK